MNNRGMTGSYAASPAPLQRRLQELFLTIRDYRDTSGRLLATPFMRLPSRADLPQYYEFIKKPIELEAICTKVNNSIMYYKLAYGCGYDFSMGRFDW